MFGVDEFANQLHVAPLTRLPLQFSAWFTAWAKLLHEALQLPLMHVVVHPVPGTIDCIAPLVH
jgi:hypothetical protein